MGIVADLSQDVHISTLQLWLQSLVKPQKHLMYEGQFAVALKNQGATFVSASFRQPMTLLSYDSSRRQFEGSCIPSGVIDNQVLD
jgi:hypothetical protein